MVVVLAASGPRIAGQGTIASPTATSSGQRLVERAAGDLANCSSLEVRLRQRVNMYDQQWAGSGIYLHKHAEQGLLIRLELKLQVDDRLTTVLQVSDGRFLWLRRDMPDGTSLGRVDLERLNDALSEVGSASFAGPSANLLALGGLPRLLAGLVENFAFQTPAAAQLDTTPVWVVQGRWKPHVLATLYPKEQERILAGKLPDAQGLPRQMPTSVRVVLRQQDLVPLRIDYRRLLDDDSTETGNRDQSMLVMDFYGVRSHESLDDGLFSYQPGSQEVQDLTDLYLQKLLPPQSAEE